MHKMKLFVGKFSVRVIRACNYPKSENGDVFRPHHSNFHSGRTVITVLIGHLLIDRRNVLLQK